MANLTVTPGSVVVDGTRTTTTIYAKLTVTGSYPGTNGDIFDPAALFPQYKSAPKLPIMVEVEGSGDWSFVYVPGATLGAGKLKVIVTSTGAEHATAGYNAGITGDTNIYVRVVAFKA